MNIYENYIISLFTSHKSLDIELFSGKLFNISVSSSNKY